MRCGFADNQEGMSLQVEKTGRHYFTMEADLIAVTVYLTNKCYTFMECTYDTELNALHGGSFIVHSAQWYWALTKLETQ